MLNWRTTPKLSNTACTNYYIDCDFLRNETSYWSGQSRCICTCQNISDDQHESVVICELPTYVALLFLCQVRLGPKGIFMKFMYKACIPVCKAV